MSLRILRPGLLTTVQDSGRHGLQHIGVVPCGAMDPVALELANGLVGNRADEAVLEITLIGPEIAFESDALVALRQYPWPGNVRELRNVIERLMIMVPGDRISSRDVTFLDQGPPVDGPASTQSFSSAPLHEARDQFERDYILRALAAQQGNISRTADMLGIERSNLYRKMRSFGIAPSRRGEDEEIA